MDPDRECQSRQSENLDSIKSSLKEYIRTSLLPAAGIESFEDEDSFLEKGIIDSTGVLELLEFLESSFRIKVEDEEVVPANLDSLAKLSAFIWRKTSHRTSVPSGGPE